MSLARTIARLLAVALPLYFVREMLQAPAFTGMPAGWVAATAVCPLATAGDGVIVLLVFAIDALAFRDARWFVPPRSGRYATVVLLGVAIQVAVERVMVHRLGRWVYQPSQPLVPLVEIGILPFLQPLVLLPLTFWGLARMESRVTVDS